MSRQPVGPAALGRGAATVVQHRETRRRFRRRAVFVGLMLAVVAGMFGWRLASLQLLEPERFVAHGEAQRIKTLRLRAGRGAIVDRNGVDLALSVPGQSMIANPRRVEDPVRAARALAQVLGADPEVLERRLSSDKSFVYLGRQVDLEVAEATLALKISGVYSQEEWERIRPGGDSALSILGRTDIDSIGISGMELAYDGLLSGTDGERRVEMGMRGASIPGGEYWEEPAADGRTLALTLDRALQFEAERLLLEGVEAVGAKGGVLVAMRPATGEILATATVRRSSDGVVRISSEHRAATWTYEPGSIMKPLTVSAILDRAVAAPDTVREVPPRLEVHDATFSDSPFHETVDLTLADIIRRSSNVGTILWAQDLGAEALYEQLREFGLGSVTDLDFPGEARGILHPPGAWSGTSLPTIAIGQGVSTTPLQMLTAYSALANGGVRPAPTLVLGTRDDDGVFEPRRPGPSLSVLPAAVAAEVVGMMEQVVASGTGTRAQVPGYRVAGKTGTAWKVLPTGGYGSKGNRSYVASFVGFLPAEAPRLAVIVVVDEPAGGTYSGGRVAAPVFAEFARFAVRQLRIPSAYERVELDREGRVMALTPARHAILREAAEASRLEQSGELVAASATGG
ncbi:MAG: penicillin-binding protein 2 [Actinomycetota bacterium]|nr:penicillin-binding protein 2 [Actinomycetota bacterium]